MPPFPKNKNYITHMDCVLTMLLKCKLSVNFTENQN